MASARVVVLYEDRRGKTPEFGLHKLLVRLVADRAGREPWRKLNERITGHPCSGNANLLKKARAVNAIAPSGETVVAVFDDDKVRNLLKLPKDACKRDVLTEMLVGCSDPTRLRTVLLERNVESLLEELRPRAGRLCISHGHFDNAIRRKIINDRDMILTAASREDQRPIRQELLLAVPSLVRLRESGPRSPGAAPWTWPELPPSSLSSGGRASSARRR